MAMNKMKKKKFTNAIATLGVAAGQLMMINEQFAA
jgi:hypothetical protein